MIRNSKLTSTVRAAFVAVAVTGLGACATGGDIEAINMKLDELNEKLNTALQTSAAAKIDATTALGMAVELDEKVN